MRDEELQMIQRDPDLPGLHLLLDVQRLAELLQPMLPDRAISTLKPCYIRYKPGTNCLVKYRLTGNDGERVVYAKAFHRNDQHKLSKRIVDDNAQRLVFRSHLVVVNLFPLDDKLRLLSRLFNTQQRTALLKRTLFDNSTFTTSTLQVLQYKPERRLVARLTSDNGEQAVLKLYTPSRFRQAVNTCRQTIDGQRILPLIGRSNRHHLLVYRWLPGQPLSEAWIQPGFCPGKLEAVGAHLARFHRKKVSDKYALRDSVRYHHLLSQLADSLGQQLPSLQGRVSRLVARLNHTLQHIDSKMTRIHGDFYAKQVLLNDAQVTLIDLDDTCRWYPACDLGLFIAHLERDCLHNRLTRQQADEYQGALLKGYQSVRKYSHYQVWLFTAAGLLQLAHHPFRNCEPDWPRLTQEIIALSEHYLNKALAEKSQALSQPGCTGTTEADKLIDPAMPWLAQLQNIEHIAPEVTSALISRCPQLQDAQLTQVMARRHKPGKRALLEFVFRLSNDEALSILGKVRARGFDRRTWQINCELSALGFNHSNPQGVQVPTPLGMLPDYRVWFQKKVRGDPLFSAFCDKENTGLPERVAQAIWQLHSSAITSGRARTIADELATLQQGMTRVSEQHPQWRKRLNHLLQQCQALAAQLPQVPGRPIHRDFYHDQMIVNGHALYLLDLDLLAMGDPALDLGNFVAHIQEQCLRDFGDLYLADARLQRFIQHYQDLTRGDIASRVEIHRLLSLTRHIYISQRIPARNKVTESLLNYCEQAVRRY